MEESSVKAIVSGAFLDPGLMTTSVSPFFDKVATKAEAHR